MAAAAFLRSVARKMARAPPPPPPPHPRPLLARLLHGSPCSDPGASLPPPPTGNEIQIQNGGGNRLMVAMAALGLPSLASKMSRAPPPDHHLLHPRGLSSSTPRHQPWLPAEKFFYFSQFAILGLMFFWLIPMVKELRNSIRALTKETDTLKKAAEECRRKHTHVLRAQNMPASDIY